MTYLIIITIIIYCYYPWAVIIGHLLTNSGLNVMTWCNKFNLYRLSMGALFMKEVKGQYKANQTPASVLVVMTSAFCHADV